jgi:hypothetical protein
LLRPRRIAFELINPASKKISPVKTPGGGNMPETLLLPEYVARINASWRKTADGVLETARLCAQAQDGLRSKDRAKLIKQLDFNAATFSKLVKIGSREQLQDESVKSLLPPSYSIVYEVAKLDDAELQSAIADKIINPGMTRSELNAWIGKRKNGDAAEAKEDPEKIIATIKVPADYDDNKRNQLVKALAKLETQFGCSLERPSDPEEAAYDRMVLRVNDDIRKRARRFIADLKRHRLQGLGKLSPAEKKRYWSFSDEELEIPLDATWEQVKQTLELVGAGDQFERIRDEALRLFDVPETVVSGDPPESPEEALEVMRSTFAMRRANDGVNRNPNKYAGFKFT